MNESTIEEGPQKAVEKLRLVHTVSIAVFKFLESNGSLNPKAEAIYNLHKSMLDIIGKYDRNEMPIDEFYIHSQMILQQTKMVIAQVERKHDFEPGGIACNTDRDKPILPRLQSHIDILPDTTDLGNWPNIPKGTVVHVNSSISLDKKTKEILAKMVNNAYSND